MIPTIILHEAEVEFWEAVAYYEQKSPGLGLDFAAEVERSVHTIRQFPDRWPLREDETRRYLTRRFPFLVVYAYLNNQIWIITFAHCRRRPGCWSDRAYPHVHQE